jgi:hypothetical protein
MDNVARAALRGSKIRGVQLAIVVDNKDGGGNPGELGAAAAETPKDQVAEQSRAAAGGGGGSAGHGGVGGGIAGLIAAMAIGATPVAATAVAAVPLSKRVGGLTVTVIDGRGTPISGAQVIANGADGSMLTGTSDASGLVSFTSVEEGDYDVGALYADYDSASTQTHVVPLASNSVIIRLTPVEIALEVEQISFTGNYPMEQDALGVFAAPEWIADRAPKLQAPICYKRGASIGLSARFRVRGARRRAVSVEVRGQATAGAQTLVWTATVSVAPSDTQATITATSAVALPHTVACYEALTITWTAMSRGIVARPAGSSVHLCYVVLSTPVGTPSYWTLLDILCRASEGAIDEQFSGDRRESGWCSRANAEPYTLGDQTRRSVG